MKKYMRDLEDGELSDTDSENDRKLVNGKKKESSGGRKSTSASQNAVPPTTMTTATSKAVGSKPARTSGSETEVKTYLKSIQDTVKLPARSSTTTTTSTAASDSSTT